MARWHDCAVSVPMAACMAFALMGCVTSKKYKMAKADAPPVQSLGWTVQAPVAELTLESLIVFKGPGTWKSEARWDEYVVKITNRSLVPLHISSVGLIDIIGETQVPGVNPWQLEKLSATNWDKYGGVGLSLLAGSGVVGLAGFVAFTGAPFLGGAAAATAALALIPIVAVVDITAVAFMNHSNKAEVQKEFNRRRLALPLMIDSDAAVQGSFFFPMTPGPQRLMVKGQAGEAPVELVLELKPLAGLHLKPAEEAVKPP
jgi:hypothetical protein